MSNTATDICNASLDQAGIDFTLGDIEDGTRPAQVCLRAYWTCLRQLLRAAHWGFSRKAATLTLLADATGNTPNVGTQVVPPGTFVYEYAWPTDCMKMRFVPANWPGPNPGPAPGNITPPNPAQPIMTGLGQAPVIPYRIIPARWLQAFDSNYPIPPGSAEAQGQSPEGRVVLLTNQQNAIAVYTALIKEPVMWDFNFREAMTAYLAQQIIMALTKDKRLAMAIRRDQIAIVKEKVIQARLSSANETGFPQSNDIAVDWMGARRTGGSGWPGGWGGGFGGFGNFDGGCFFGGYDGLAFADGAVY